MANALALSSELTTVLHAPGYPPDPPPIGATTGVDLQCLLRPFAPNHHSFQDSPPKTTTAYMSNCMRYELMCSPPNSLGFLVRHHAPVVRPPWFEIVWVCELRIMVVQLFVYAFCMTVSIFFMLITSIDLEDIAASTII